VSLFLYYFYTVNLGTTKTYKGYQRDAPCVYSLALVVCSVKINGIQFKLIFLKVVMLVLVPDMQVLFLPASSVLLMPQLLADSTVYMW